MKYNAIIGQSGGPTAVINASLCGVISQVLKTDFIDKLYGMNFGIEGFMKESFFDLTALSEEKISKLKYTPSSALGSSRHKLHDDELPEIKKILEKHNIRYFFLIGGNDTMDTIHRIETYCSNNGYDLTGIGIPKTVDNDLFDTDHTPGFVSAAHYNILSVLQGGLLAQNMKKVDKYVVYQTIGRDAGWLAAATALAKNSNLSAPHLIYMPEKTFSREQCLADTQKYIKEYGFCSIVCGEGIKYEDGTPVSNTKTKDKFNNSEFGAMGGSSAALSIHKMIYDEFKFRGEFQITESLIMCAADRAVISDIEESFNCGIEAVRLAEKKESGFMITIERLSSSPYKIKFGKTPLSKVAVNAKPMPEKYFNESGNYVSTEFIEDYMKPLLPPLPDYTVLTEIKSNEK
ncbi:MAG: diphosphate--fructose-6-phosphate 1-phosphotransferase [Spirochaetes bacterium]|nr:diphosphate--fructose-6-phosphate 1-phosphotransferase [Spirochaetota bacterium]